MVCPCFDIIIFDTQTISLFNYSCTFGNLWSEHDLGGQNTVGTTNWSCILVTTDWEELHMIMKFRVNIWMAHRLLQPMSMQRLHMFTHNVAPAARCIGPTDWIFLVLWTGFCCELFTHDS